MNLGELAVRMKGRLRDADPNTPVRAFATDSREVARGDVFLAIQGLNVDGHHYVEECSIKGGVCSVVERPCPFPRIEVESTVNAIGRLGRSLRDEFSYPVVGITGSNGKTSTKEFTAAALSCLGPVIKSEGNRNSEFTSPLVWFALTEAHRSAVIEMGMRGYGQIAHLADIAQPHIGVVTCIGTAHVEMVGSREGIVKAKGELLERLSGPAVAVIWHEDEYLNRLREYAPGQVVTFGHSTGSDVRVVGYRPLSIWASDVLLDVFGQQYAVKLPTIGRHQALNAAAAVAAAVVCGADAADAVAALFCAELPPLRMQAVEWRGATILVDTYNASPDSTVAALKTLEELPCLGRRIAVLGEMRELGNLTEGGHRSVGSELARSGVDFALLTGGPTKWIADEALVRGFPAHHLQSEETLDLQRVETLLRQVSPGDIVLIKGSRALGLEKAVEAVCT